MQQSEFFPIPSPCKRICTTNAQGICIGCLRSREERFQWLDYSEFEKRMVLEKCRLRLRQARYRLWRKQQEEHPSRSVQTTQDTLFTDSGKPYRRFNQMSLFHAAVKKEAPAETSAPQVLEKTQKKQPELPF